MSLVAKLGQKHCHFQRIKNHPPHLLLHTSQSILVSANIPHKLNTSFKRIIPGFDLIFFINNDEKSIYGLLWIFIKRRQLSQIHLFPSLELEL